MGGTLTGPLYWTATGGNTSRSAQDRASDIINVLDHGAICDGVTNDTAAFTSAFSYAVASGGKTVVIPAGKCCFLPNGITVPSGVSLEGLSFFSNSLRILGSTTTLSPPSSSIKEKPTAPSNSGKAITPRKGGTCERLFSARRWSFRA